MQPVNVAGAVPKTALARIVQTRYQSDMSQSHDHIHDSPKSLAERIAHARSVCEQAGERFTPLRAHVLELVIADGGAVKAYDLIDRLSPDIGSPKPPTIYRALEFLSKLGLIHRVEALNAFIACDHQHDGALAEFFVCENCAKVEERHAHDHVDCKPDGFLIKRSVVEHYGLCVDCAA